MLSKLESLDLKRAITMWSPGLDYCLLALGRIEAVVTNQNEIYDYAAGKLIALEAGAKITKFDGTTDKEDLNDKFVISNGTEIHKKILNIL
jgi:fructose-1,6-bisphosphatase/inositol monophosphatase family enzyme